MILPVPVEMLRKSMNELNPLSIADILDEMVELFWRKLWLYAGLSAVIQCPAFFIIDFCSRLMSFSIQARGSTPPSVGDFFPLFPLILVLIVFYFFTRGVVTVVTKSLFLQTPVHFF